MSGMEIYDRRIEMIAKLKRKSVIIGIIAFIVVALAVALAVPAFAAGGTPSSPPGPQGKNFTTVQGTITSIGSGKIVIATTGTPGSVTLSMDDSTNLSVHGGVWSNLSELNGKPVTAIYKNNQTGTPVASQIMINMPKPIASARPPVDSNIARIQGILKVGDDGSISVGDVSGLKLDKNTNLTLFGFSSLKAADGKQANAVYNKQTNKVLQLMVNMPAPGTDKLPVMPRPAPGDTKNRPDKNIIRVQGTFTLSSDAKSVNITPPNNGTPVTLLLGDKTVLTLHGYSSLADAGGQTVMAVYDKTTAPLAAGMIMINMPQPAFNGAGPKPNMGGGFGPRMAPPFKPGAQPKPM